MGEWIRPADALRKWMEDEILMAPSVHHDLQCLSDGLDDIEARMKAVPRVRGEATSEIEMRPGIVLVPLRTPTLPPATHTNCCVVGGDEVVVIDPASPYDDVVPRPSIDRAKEHCVPVDYRGEAHASAN